jgi:hypothetical protein
VYEGGTGTLKLATAGGSVDIVKGSDSSETMAKFYINGAAELYYDNAAKLATTATGADITGTLTADGLTVDGGTTDTVTNFTSTDTSAFVRFTDGTGSTYAGTTYQNGNGAFAIYTGGDTGGSGSHKSLTIDGGGDVALYDNTGSSQGFYWDASTQRLGLGDTSPNETLSAVGNIEASNTSSNVRLMATASGVANAYFGFNNSGSTQNGIPNNSAYVTVPQSYPISFGTANQNRMTITSGGSVGIGTTSPSNKLSVEAGSNPAISVTETGAGAVILQGTGSGGRVYSNSGNKLLLGANGQNSHLIVDTGGNVGIGTASPSDKLHVEGDIRVNNAIESANNLNLEAENGVLRFYTGSGSPS